MLTKRRVWELLEPSQPGDRVGRAVDVFLLGLIFLSVLAVLAGTVPAVAARYGAALQAFEAFSVAVFSVEYLARLWAAPADPRYAGAVRGRLRYARTPMALVDLAAVLPFYLPFLGVDLRFARALRLLRVFRLAKLGRYVAALGLFRNVVRAQREELVLTGSVILLFLVIASSLMYYAEHDAQPDKFASIPAAMWWAAVTMTTVGYGDVYPVTAVGRLLGGIVAFLGIGAIALPTAILGAGFLEEVARLRAARAAEAAASATPAAAPSAPAPAVCPHCGRPLA
jgi:voltage-gated potassium channel